MAPKSCDISTTNKLLQEESTNEVVPKKKNSYKIVWRNVGIFMLLHTMAFYGLYLVITKVSLKTSLFQLLYAHLTSLGVTAGSHRLWSHKAYKAKLPFRIFLGFFQTGALQNHIYEWSRDHRAHHKFTETNADPHDASKGFFFSHMGWLLVKKHPDVIAKGKTIDCSDLLEDPVVRFQKKYYLILAPLCCFIIPALFTWYFFGDSYMDSLYVSVFRYVLSLHLVWNINSVAHMFGNKPFDKHIHAVESTLIQYCSIGENWHNYHHTFPWDYKAAELPIYSVNLTCGVIDLMAAIGQAYDLKTTSPEMVKNRVKRTGDGTWRLQSSIDNNATDSKLHEQVWGWGDEDMSELHKSFVNIEQKED